MFKPAPLLAETALNCVTCKVSAGSLAAPMGKEGLNNKSCVMLGKIETRNLIQQVYGGEAISSARVFQWRKRFRENRRQR
jgi:hypothetical protein